MSNSKNRSIFAENLKYYMRRQGIDRNQLCKALDFKYTTVSEWLVGNRYPRIDKIELLANYFGVQKSDLIEERTVVTQIEEKPLRFEQELKLPFLQSEEEFVTLPVVCGGKPLDEETGAENEETVRIPLNYLKGRSSKDYFVLKVTGDSMYPLYLENDRVLVLRRGYLKYSGQILAVACGDGAAELKRVEYQEGKTDLRLASVNPIYPSVRLTEEDKTKFRILGIPQMLLREIED